jgi:hypothetical protein
MDQVRLRRFVRRNARTYCGVAALFAASALSGCFALDPNGFELEAKLGGHRVSAHKSESTMTALECPAWKSWTIGCPKTQQPTEMEPK